jgi:hypothetical protein
LKFDFHQKEIPMRSIIATALVLLATACVSQPDNSSPLTAGVGCPSDHVVEWKGTGSVRIPRCVPYGSSALAYRQR